ncbi:hypothetical protein C8P63_11744 [Melghirimyces profundicolus]|uniref:Uncharacterized protein n=1 Tax=Melghirimyces profundicolus TaxID=1242148 RepID=A0A2T6BQP8_9BACL|nr:hypothetical protein [Melghirimyces profundicolus]PTX58297.1 hypothetical protein C8P63_11744 [Melghirimyces profundicolus]
MIEKKPDEEPINAKGKYRKRNRLDTRRAWTPERIDSQVEQAVNSHDPKPRPHKGVV